MRSNIDIKNLANAVQYWLSYWDTVSRSNILQEGSLRYSISEVIERKYNGLCVLELPHPCFKNRNIDITWSDEIKDDAIFEEFTQRGFERKTNNQLIEAIDKLYQNSDVIECKVVSKHTIYKSEIQRIFNDLCGLYFFKLKYPNRRAFFLLSGGSELFNSIKKGVLIDVNQNNQSDLPTPQELAKSYIQDKGIACNKSSKDQNNNTELNKNGEKPQQELETPNVFADWLSFDLKQRTRTLELKQSEDIGNRLNLEGDNSNKTNYDIFLDDYKFKEKVQYKHITFKTSLIALNEASTEIETEHSVALWEILPEFLSLEKDSCKSI